MSNCLSLKIFLFSVLLLGQSFTDLNASQNEKGLITDPYKYVLNDLQCYITKYYPKVRKFGVLKRDYLPKRLKKRNTCARIMYIDFSKDKGTDEPLDYVLEVIPLRQAGNLCEINVICYELHLVPGRVELIEICVMAYTFEKNVDFFLFKEALRALPVEFK